MVVALFATVRMCGEAVSRPFKKLKSRLVSDNRSPPSLGDDLVDASAGCGEFVGGQVIELSRSDVECFGDG
jgi:hypothetical protein